MFQSTLYVGSHLQQMTFLLDTGSDISWLPTDDCQYSYTCKENAYHYNKSYTFEKTKRKFTIRYAVGEAKGILMRDDLSLTKSSDTIIKDFEFLGIYQKKNMDGIKSDGLLGLGPKKFYEVKGERWILVEEMRRSGLINKAIFSVMLKKIGDVSLGRPA